MILVYGLAFDSGAAIAGCCRKGTRHIVEFLKNEPIGFGLSRPDFLDIAPCRNIRKESCITVVKLRFLLN